MNSVLTPPEENMKLLIITQKVDQHDDVLGFMHGWIAAFAHECERVTVIALGVGAYHLPDNVRVHSLGKESGIELPRFIARLVYLARFYRLLFQTRHEYDAVFVHMNHEYVLLGGILWRMWRKTIALWYAHGHVPSSLPAALRIADLVFTSTKSGFRIPSPKVHVIGQGIDTERFRPHRRFSGGDEPFRVIVVGRISPVKDYETLLRAIRISLDRGCDIVCDIIGAAPRSDQETYLEKLKRDAADLGIAARINFRGKVSNQDIPDVLSEADCFVNTSRTGSLDKAMVEAMAARLPVLTSNEAMREVLGDMSDQLMFPPGDDRALAGLLCHMVQIPGGERLAIGDALRDIVSRDHDLRHFVRKICDTLRSV